MIDCAVHGGFSLNATIRRLCSGNLNRDCKTSKVEERSLSDTISSSICDAQLDLFPIYTSFVFKKISSFKVISLSFSIFHSFKAPSEDCVRMMRANDRFPQLETCFHQQDSLLIAALELQRECEVAHAGQRGRVLLLKHTLFSSLSLAPPALRPPSTALDSCTSTPG